MAKKTRIDRRGTIRSLVRKFPTGPKPHWSITKRAAVNQRRRHIDEVFENDTIQVLDSVTPHLNKFFYEILTTSDTAFIGGNIAIINSQTITDDGGTAESVTSSATASVEEIPEPNVSTPTININDVDGVLTTDDLSNWVGFSGTADPNTFVNIASIHTVVENKRCGAVLHNFRHA